MGKEFTFVINDVRFENGIVTAMALMIRNGRKTMRGNFFLALKNGRLAYHGQDREAIIPPGVSVAAMIAFGQRFKTMHEAALTVRNSIPLSPLPA